MSVNQSEEPGDQETEIPMIRPVEVDQSPRTHSDHVDDDYTCGIGPWRPKSLQFLANVKVAFVIILLTTVSVALNVALFSTAVVNWERQFGLSSKVIGAGFTFFDISSLASLPIVTYLGGQTNSHRPRWIGFNILLIAVGLLIIGSTQFMSDLYEYGNLAVRNTSVGLCSPGNHTVDPSHLAGPGCGSKEVSGHSVAVLPCIFLGLFFMGFGITPLFTLGIPYIDDHVERKKSPLYCGILFAMYGIGPLIGYPMAAYFNSIYVDYYRVDTSTIGINKSDPRWVGAWWMGYFFNAVALILCVIPLLMLPKKLRKPNEDDDASARGDRAIAKQMYLHDKLKEFPRSMKRLFTNATLMCVILATTADAAMLGAVLSFSTKYVLNQFRTSVSLAAMIVAIGFVIPSVSGIFVGGVLLRKFKPTLKTIARNATVIQVVCLVLILPMLFIGCENYTFAGINHPYTFGNNSDTSVSSGLSAQCNSECSCPSNAPFNPVCGSNGVTYYSACLAGCRGLSEIPGGTNVTLTGCTCVDDMETERQTTHINGASFATEGVSIDGDGYNALEQVTTTAANVTVQETKNQSTHTQLDEATTTPDFGTNSRKATSFDLTTLSDDAEYTLLEVDGGSAKPGICGRQCTKQLVVFTLLTFILSLVKHIPQTSAVEILLRSVKPTDKSFALGLRSMFAQVFAWIPTPIYIGAAFDSTCQYWGQTPCGDRAACWVYDLPSYRMKYFGIILAIKMVAFACFLLTWFTLRGKRDADAKEDGYKAVAMATNPAANGAVSPDTTTVQDSDSFENLKQAISQMPAEEFIPE